MLAIVAYWLVIASGTTDLKPIIDDIKPTSIAARAGLQPGDEILLINEKTAPTWGHAKHVILKNILDDKSIQLTVRHANGKIDSVILDLTDPSIEITAGQVLSSLGLRQRRSDTDPVIGKVIRGSSADSAKLRANDRILSVDCEPITRWSQLVRSIQTNPGETLMLKLKRENAELSLSLIPGEIIIDDKIIGFVGMQSVPVDPVDNPLYRTVSPSVLGALNMAILKTGDISIMSLKVFGLLIKGELSLSNLSGPVTIGYYAGVTASAGLISFVSFIALISIAIAVLNLLPIPLLDGGHLVLHSIEAIFRKPVSRQFLINYHMIGVIVLAGFFIVVFFIDIVRFL